MKKEAFDIIMPAVIQKQPPQHDEKEVSKDTIIASQPAPAQQSQQKARKVRKVRNADSL